MNAAGYHPSDRPRPTNRRREASRGVHRIDGHQRESQVCIVDEDGQVLLERRVRTSGSQRSSRGRTAALNCQLAALETQLARLGRQADVRHRDEPTWTGRETRCERWCRASTER